jgi:hypothetical protein
MIQFLFDNNHLLFLYNMNKEQHLKEIRNISIDTSKLHFVLPCSCKTVLHPIHLFFFVIKPAKPPTFGVMTVLTDVCSPSKIIKEISCFSEIFLSKFIYVEVWIQLSYHLK